MTLDDGVSDLKSAKLAFAKERGIEPCPNDKCGFTGCTCGKRCGCNIPPSSTSVVETCDPCAEFKRKKEAEARSAAREA